MNEVAVIVNLSGNIRPNQLCPGAKIRSVSNTFMEWNRVIITFSILHMGDPSFSSRGTPHVQIVAAHLMHYCGLLSNGVGYLCASTCSERA